MDIPDLQVRPARLEQVQLVRELLSDAARWLAERGIDQWPHPFPIDIVQTSVSRGETYVAWDGAGTVGTFALSWTDPGWWGERPPDAGYLHRLAVARDAAGHGLGEHLLGWAAQHVQEAGRAWLRLDCGATNVRLRRYYEELGFLHCGDVDVLLPGAGTSAATWTGSLYQRRVSGQPSNFSRRLGPN